MIIKFNDVAAQWDVIKEECLPKIEKYLEYGDYIENEIVNEFEYNFADYIGCNHAIAVSNGTNALKLSLQALNLQGSTCVIIPANTFISNAFAVSYFNYDLKLIDCDDSYGMKSDDLHAWFAGKRENYDNVVVIPVHLYGYPSNLERIMSLCNLYQAYVIEDCSQAHGAMVRIGKVGNFGELSVFSCYAGKNLGAAGEAAIITTNNNELSIAVRELRNIGSPVKYVHSKLGWNDRPQGIQCLILNEKLKYLDEWNSYRSRAAELYNKLLKDTPVITPKEPEWSVTGDTFVLGCRLPKSLVYYNHTESHPDRNNTELGIYNEFCGLDKLHISFGHDEYLYQVLKQNKDKHKIKEKYWNII